MSEHQRIAFRAIDGPVSGPNLKYMQQQSSRAEITPWSFDNEYHYGDFGGNALEMLRRGYDLHVHYANFGIRRLMIRLPHGLPDIKAADVYLDEQSLNLIEDKKGPGAILSIEPYIEAGQLDDLFNFNELVDRLVPLRAEIFDGDLRPLYLAHLSVARDDNHDPEETKDGPIPAGLNKLTDAQKALAEFFGMHDALIAAAAEGCPPLPAAADDPQNQYAAWLLDQPQKIKDAWLAQWMIDPSSVARREMMDAFRQSQSVSLWPTMQLGRTIRELETRAEEIAASAQRKKAETAARARAKKLAAMAADPAKTLRETEELAAKRGSESYRQIAELLADLREALAGADQAGLAEEQARKLKNENPSRTVLVSELRKKGFVPKGRSK